MAVFLSELTYGSSLMIATEMSKKKNPQINYNDIRNIFVSRDPYFRAIVALERQFI
jgi:hypothetical protein